ncbi:SDR family NAD(P)-dependent oxidoreductase [Candidatus Woesearchaeota archaeon]|nr:SDR family NAD(P)-dependent oxidoreductase [Candidatus Woesearchaeota archaeon]
METALVTGGAGFIGSHLCEELLGRGMKVVCFDNFEENYPKSVKEANIRGLLDDKNFVLVEGDVRKKEDVSGVFRQHKINYVFHIAAKTGVRPSVNDPVSYFGTNVNGTINVLDACVKSKVKKFVFASSSSVYGSARIPFSESGLTVPDSPYGVSKLAAEHICRIYHNLYGIKSVCLRFFTVYGPRGRPDMAPYIFTDRISRQLPVRVFGDGSSMRDYTYVKDAVAGLVKAMEADMGFEVINIGSSKPLKLVDFIGVIEKLLGKKADVAVEGEQPGDMKATYADISKASLLIGFKPSVSVEQGMEEFVKWYRESSSLVV